ncbi:MAG: CAP domain-containing protein [Acidobacteria bacterium]|nr:CAP domain-containing protein [Acidobacteriota bacterium]MBS1866023.1 CAP domain-containing protein [Acidobacteriota bacterium]
MALVLSFLIFPAKLFSQQTPGPDEKVLLDAVNHERAGEKLPPLKWDANLAAAARDHVRKMTERNRLSHQFSGEPSLTARASGAGARFSMVAENVAEAPNVSELHIGWMNSLPHRANILNPKLTAIGIAVEMRGEQYFAVQDFSTAVGALSREEQEKQVGALLQKLGLKIASSSEEARKACDSGSGYSGARPMAILHFETPDLNQLPDQVADTVKKGAYRTAAAGACSVKATDGFSHFRIAILLYGTGG